MQARPPLSGAHRYSDNCRCPKCVNQDTMQRAFDTFSVSLFALIPILEWHIAKVDQIPEDVKPSQITTTERGVQITCWLHLSLRGSLKTDNKRV